jgi:hypothetical protein
MKMWRIRRRKMKEEKEQLETRIFQQKFVHMNRPFIAPLK